jgi:hypothetical protein
MAGRPVAVKTAVSYLPRYGGEIERAYGDSSELHAICAELHACVRALSYWGEESSSDAPARLREYQTLLEELIQELPAWLETHGYLGGSGSDPLDEP